MITAFLHGMVVGLAVAVPAGPVGVLCVRRTLAQGRLIGFVSGLGAAASCGLTLVSDTLTAGVFAGLTMWWVTLALATRALLFP